MEYLCSVNIRDALRLMKKWKNRGTLIAGGTNVIPELRTRTIQPQVLIDISHLKNLADASPAADTAVPLLALDAMVMAERDGEKHREIPIDQFFLGPNQTVFKKDEQNEPL